MKIGKISLLACLALWVSGTDSYAQTKGEKTKPVVGPEYNTIHYALLEHVSVGEGSEVGKSLQEMGVLFPVGANASFDEERRILTLTNTVGNHEVFQAWLDRVNDSADALLFRASDLLHASVVSISKKEFSKAQTSARESVLRLRAIQKTYPDYRSDRVDENLESAEKLLRGISEKTGIPSGKPKRGDSVIRVTGVLDKRDLESHLWSLTIRSVADSEKRIDASEVTFQVTFFERDEEQQVRIATGRVESEYPSAPYDWNSDEEESLDYRFEPFQTDRNTLCGYAVKVLYQGIVQDQYTRPTSLLDELAEESR